MTISGALIGRLASLCHELNRDDFSVWCDFSGHVDSVFVRWNYGGWDRRDLLGSEKLEIRLDREDAEKQIAAAIKIITAASKANKAKVEKLEKEFEERERAELARLQRKYTANANLSPIRDILQKKKAPAKPRLVYSENSSRP